MLNYPITNDNIQNASQLSSVQSLFNNKFDINFDYIYSKEKSNKITMHRSEEKQNETYNLGIVDDGSVVYNYNLDHFRSNEFSKNHNGEHIIFSGCSETEGVGANIEENWSYLVYSSLNAVKKVSGYYNLGISGSGYSKIINNIYIYMEKFGNPDTIFILFPNVSRWTEWVDDESGYQTVGLNPYSPDGLLRNSKYDSNMKVLMDNLGSFVSTIRMFEKYCESNNIKLFWGSWDKYDENNYKTLFENKVFKNFVYLDMIKFEEDLGIDSLTYKDFIAMRGSLFRRDVHLGQRFHDYFSKKFLLEYNKETNNANI
jgi:hypothetical protein